MAPRSQFANSFSRCPGRLKLLFKTSKWPVKPTCKSPPSGTLLGRGPTGSSQGREEKTPSPALSIPGVLPSVGVTDSFWLKPQKTTVDALKWMPFVCVFEFGALERAVSRIHFWVSMCDFKMLPGTPLNGDTYSGKKYTVNRDSWLGLRRDVTSPGLPAVLPCCSDRSLQGPLHTQHPRGLARTDHGAWY